MARKRRIKEDAFDWVPGAAKAKKKRGAVQPSAADDSESEESPSAVGRVASSEHQETTESEINPQQQKARSIYVMFKKVSGEIIAIREISSNREPVSFHWPVVPEGMDVVEFVLTGEISDKQLLEIHSQYQVVKGERGKQLAPKK